MLTLGTALAVIVALGVLEWARRKGECDDCGSTLMWCDPELRHMPATRCFECEGPHLAYLRPGYHGRTDFAALPTEPEESSE